VWCRRRDLSTWISPQTTITARISKTSAQTVAIVDAPQESADTALVAVFPN
jgi:hypothetical protein